MLAKKKQPPLDLGGEILRLRGEIENFIAGKVEELKNSPTGRDLPREVLRSTLTRNDSCLCRAASHILATEQ